MKEHHQHKQDQPKTPLEPFQNEVLPPANGDQHSELSKDTAALLEAHKQRKIPLWRRFTRLVFRMAVVLMLLLLLLRWVISFPVVQNQLVSWTTTYLSDRLHTKVEVGYVNIDFFDELLLENVLIEDLDQDTILFAARIYAQFGLVKLLQKQIEVKELTLSQVQFNQIAPKNGRYSNLQFIFDELFPPKAPEPPTPETDIDWSLSIKKINLDRLSYRNDNYYTKTLTHYQVAKGRIIFKDIDLKNRQIALQQVYFDKVSADYFIDSLAAERIFRASDTIQYPVYQDTFERTPWLLQVQHLKLTRSDFHFKDFGMDYGVDSTDFDYADMHFQQINTDIRDLKLYNNEITAQLRQLQLKEQKGFVLSNIRGDLLVNDKMAMLSSAKIETPYSELQDTVAFEYRKASDWGNFNNRIKLNVVFKESRVAMKDILMLAPVLKNNPFFKNNEEEIIEISGNIYDRINRLRAKNLKLQIGKTTKLEGEFKSRAITDINEATLNLNIKRLNTNTNNIQALLKGIKLPEEVMRLGNLSFSGEMDGFLLNFVTKGRLKTDLGVARSDMNFNFIPGKDYGRYSGTFALKSFDLGKWLNEPDFGTITFGTKVNGQGFALNEIKAELDAKVADISYRNYTYKDIKIDGFAKSNKFDGELIVKDQNIDLRFIGEVDFNDTLPKFNLTSHINKIDLRPLNLVDIGYALSGDVQLNFTGIDPNEIDGFAVLRNFKMQDDTATYELDSLQIASGVDYNKVRFYDIKSDIVTGNLRSNFDFVNVSSVLLNYVTINYPKFTDALQLKSRITGDSLFVYQPQNRSQNEYYRLHLTVNQTRNWLNLVDPEIGEIKNLIINSHFDSKSDRDKPKLFFDLSSPLFEFGEIKIGQASIIIRALGDSCKIDAHVGETFIGDSLDIPGVEVSNSINGDVFLFNVTGNKVGEIVKNLNISGQIEAIDDLFEVHIDTSDIIIYNREWSISDGNLVKIYQNRIVPENVKLSNQQLNETIALDSFGVRGIRLALTNIGLDWLNEFADLGENAPSGRLSAEVTIEDLFNLQNFKAVTSIDTLRYFGFEIGQTNATVEFPTLQHPIAIDANILGIDNSRLAILGTYTLPNLNRNFKKDHYFNFKVETRDYPLNIIEAFIGDYVSNTRGQFDSDIIVAGTPSDPELSGTVRLKDAGLLVDYLQTDYRIPKATLKITNNAFIIKGRTLRDIYGQVSEGCMVYDQFNNTAFVEGAVLHNDLQFFSFDIRMNTDEFVLLNTKKQDNDLFYGTAIGKADLWVTGSLEQPDVAINATSLPGTKVILPISSSGSASEVKFIRFVNNDNDSTNAEVEYSPPVGLNLEMNLDITPSAEIRLVIDEQAGDEILGRGNGNLQIGITRVGEFSMSGTYTIEQGEYLFTFKNLINKPFEVRKGGTIVWTGDPFDATLNLDAYYRNLSVAPYNLIIEYLITDEEIVTARKSTKVDLKMALKGALFSPDISFDLEFPNVDNSIKSYVGSKLALVREDENELNRQVFGLIIFRDFLPSNAASSISSGSLVFDTGFNTLTEMLSNQLSMYVTDLLSEIVGTDGVISSINVDVGYRRAEYSDITDIDPNAVVAGNEVQLGLTNGLLDDRVIISGNVNYEDTYGQYTTDFEVEWIVTKDGRWRVRAYNRGEVVVQDYRNKAGIGISYRQEFNSFRELFKEILRKGKEKQ